MLSNYVLLKIINWLPEYPLSGLYGLHMTGISNSSCYRTLNFEKLLVSICWCKQKYNISLCRQDTVPTRGGLYNNPIDKFGLIVSGFPVRFSFCLFSKQIRFMVNSYTISYQLGHLQHFCQGISVHVSDWLFIQANTFAVVLKLHEKGSKQGHFITLLFLLLPVLWMPWVSISSLQYKGISSPVPVSILRCLYR